MYRLTLIAFAIAATGMPSSASAQTTPSARPYRGLFASGASDATQTLSISGSIATGYDTSVLAAARGGNSVGEGSDPGTLANASAGLSYSFQGERYTVGASAGTSVRYYPSLDAGVLQGSAGNLSFTMPLGSRMSISVGASAAYQPYSASLFVQSIERRPVDTPAPELDFAASESSYLSYSANAGVSYSFSQRTTVSVGANYRAADGGQVGIGDFKRQGMGATLTHNIGRGLDVRLGYSYNVARYSADRRIESHGIDAGVDYNRALSITRHTTLSFGTGSTLTGTSEQRQFRLTGGVNLNHEIGRTWRVYTSYGRQVYIHENWADPVMMHSVNAGLTGLFTRRLQFNATAQGGLGTIGAPTNSPGFDSVTGHASLSMALTRFMSMGVTYSYYHHRFDSEALVPHETLRLMDRHSVRASVNLWAPLMTLTRSNNAAR